MPYSLDTILRAMGAVEGFKQEMTQCQTGILEISVQPQQKDGFGEVGVRQGGKYAGEGRVAKFRQVEI